MVCYFGSQEVRKRLLICVRMVHVDRYVKRQDSPVFERKLTLPGILAMGAVNNFITSEFILGVAVLNNPDYVITRWQVTLLAYAIAFMALCFNVFLPHLLHKVSRFFLIWNICSFVIIIITILACNDHKQSASFVFKDFQNFTGFTSTSYVAILGLLQTAFGMCCYDAPAHMTEEIVNARKEAPRAIILSVWIGAATGFVFLIAVCFCMGSIEGVAASATGVPIVQIFYDSTGSVAGSTCLTVLLIVIDIGCANALTAEGGRAVYAFARDRGLPFSDIWSKVDAKKQIPVFAICLTVLVQIALNSIYFGTVTGFETVISIATEGFCRFHLRVSKISLLTDYRCLVRHAAIGQSTRACHGKENGSRWSLEPWSLGSPRQHHRPRLPPLHLYHFQPAHAISSHKRKHELHLRSHWCDHADRYDHLVHHWQTSIYRTRIWWCCDRGRSASHRDGSG